MESPKRISVIRMDDLPMTGTYYTTEGYLVDHPILTRTGIFEYRNPDGSIRRELRLPQDVFDRESLESYKGKPIVITHDAGLIDKDNVAEESIGTILSEGYRDGDNVKAEIVIHDTDRMKESRLKELSVGYNLELEETPGIWHGMPYDAIQRDIRVNHLALVREARAGDQVRLNIDSRDAKTILTGGRKTRMAKTKKSVRDDGVLSEEELNKAIAKYLATKDQKAVDADEEDVPQEEEKKAAVPEKAPVPAKAIAPNSAPMPAKDAPAEAPKTKVPTEDDDDAPQKVAPKETPKEAPIAKEAPAPKRQPVTIGSLSKKPEIVPEEEEDEDMSVEDRVNAVRDRDEERKAQIVPDNEDDVNEVIGSQGMDIKELMDIIDTLLAERDINKQKADCADKPKEVEPEDYSEDSEDDEEEYSDEDYKENEDEEPEDDTDDSDDDEDYEDEDRTEEEDSEDEPEDDEDDEDKEDDDEDFGDEDNEEDKFEEDECNAEWCDPEGYPEKKRTDVAKKSRADSVDRQTRQLTETMKRIIHTAYPNMRLDGKGFAYLNAACDMACEEIAKSNKKGVEYQYKQMFNADSKKVFAKPETAESARQRMIKKIVR